jgi:hypothetical protein
MKPGIRNINGFISTIVVIGLVFVMSPVAAAASNSTCPKLAVEKVVGQQTFRCSKGSGGSKVWLKVKKSVAPASKTSSCAKGGKCALGDVGPGGGKVFYVSTTFFVSTGSACDSQCLYMEAAPKDIGWFEWCSDVAKFFGVTQSSIGAGMSNTMNAAASCSSGAIRKAADFKYGNKSDWFLPSKDELSELLRSQLLGEFEDYYYSSSTEADFEAAWLQWPTGYGQFVLKEVPSIVRPVRAF